MAGGTDVGRRRKANQDSIFFDSKLKIGIVADGIGGRPGGDVASSILVGGLREFFVASGKIATNELGIFLSSKINELNRSIIEQGVASAEFEGMGTTLNTIVFSSGKMFLAHVGDSRTYLFTDECLFQITVDHNVQTFVDRGMMDTQAVQKGVKGSALMRAVGLTDYVEIDIYEKAVKPGELYLTASDGLFDMISDDAIYRTLLRHSKRPGAFPNDDLIKDLIGQANEAGGRDNITILASKVVAV